MKDSLKLTLMGNFKNLPRLRRYSTKNFSNPLFLILTPNGIENNTYSDAQSFFTYDRGDKINIEGWRNYIDIDKIEFIYKNGKKHIHNHRHPSYLTYDFNNLIYISLNILFYSISYFYI